MVSLLTTKGLIPYGGAVGSNPLVDRAGINCRTVRNGSLVLDALADPKLGRFDPRDICTAVPEALVATEPYAGFVVEDAPADGDDRSLAGMRIGIVREYMVEHTLNDAAISDRIDSEIETVLGDRLGASLVESVDPLHNEDAAVPDMAYTFQDALAEILPIHAGICVATSRHRATIPERHLDAAAVDRPVPSVSGRTSRSPCSNQTDSDAQG